MCLLASPPTPVPAAVAAAGLMHQPEGRVVQGRALCCCPAVGLPRYRGTARRVCCSAGVAWPPSCRALQDDAVGSVMGVGGGMTACMHGVA